MRKLFICILFTLSTFLNQAEGANHKKNKKYEVSLCAIFRDEARFLKEWIEFHRLMGVEHFYLLNHLSKDDYMKVLKPYIKDKIVELFQWNYPITSPGRWPPIQTSAYQFIINKAREKTTWLAIIDTDEFLFTPDGTPLNVFLEDYIGFGAVGVNWQMFGTGGVKRIKPDELLIESLNMKAEKDFGQNIHVKCIVRMDCVDRCSSAHYCVLKPGYTQVNENMEPFTGPFSPYISVDKIRINHYWSRDEDFFYNVKIARRNDFGEGRDGCINREKRINTEFDQTIHYLAPSLRKAVFR